MQATRFHAADATFAPPGRRHKRVLSWLIDPTTGKIAFWAADTGIGGQAPVDLDELDLLCIDPLPSWVWYRDMADFAETITDERAGRRLTRAIQGKGAFRRFRDELHDEYPDLLQTRHTSRMSRAADSHAAMRVQRADNPSQNWAICAQPRQATLPPAGVQNRRDVIRGLLLGADDLVMRSRMIDVRTAATFRRGRKRPGVANSDARRRGSPASMSTILVRLEAPETRRTALRRTPSDVRAGLARAWLTGLGLGVVRGPLRA